MVPYVVFFILTVIITVAGELRSTSGRGRRSGPRGGRPESVRQSVSCSVRRPGGRQVRRLGRTASANGRRQHRPTTGRSQYVGGGAVGAGRLPGGRRWPSAGRSPRADGGTIASDGRAVADGNLPRVKLTGIGMSQDVLTWRRTFPSGRPDVPTSGRPDNSV